MWSLLPEKLRVSIIVFTGVFLTLGIQYIHVTWIGDKPTFYQSASFAVTLIFAIIIPALQFLWRPVWRAVSKLNEWLFPDLNGTWTGELRSTWINPATNQGIPPIPTTFWIRQGLFSISIKMKTGESYSYSLRECVEIDRPSGKFRVRYSYSNQPKAVVGHRSQPHEGVGCLEVDFGMGFEKLTGQYFTQRKTSGDIEINRISKKIITPAGMP